MADHEYVPDQLFSEAREVIDFFLHDVAFRTDSKMKANITGKNGIVFRGQSDAKWDLIPTVFRAGDSLVQFTPQPPPAQIGSAGIRPYLGRHLHAESRAVYIFLESADSMGIPTPLDYLETKKGNALMQAAVENNVNYDYDEAYPADEFFRATALAQHHGVPTRFLDWSESAFVACFFAAYGASSFIKKVSEETKDKEISIVYFSTFKFLGSPKSEIEIVKAPRHENSHLREQRGVFTNMRFANAFFLENERWPKMNGDIEKYCFLSRVRLPASEADELLKILFDMNITRHSLMPSLANAAQAYDYTHTLFADNK